MFILPVLMFAQQDTGLSSGGVAAVLSAAFAGMVALGGILFKEFARKDTRTDKISAEMVLEIKETRDRAFRERDEAKAEAIMADKRADEWERKCHVKETELQIANMNLRAMMDQKGGL